MYMREENLLEAALSGVCVRCRTAVEFENEWHLTFCYRSGTCGQCGFDHHVCVKRA